MALETLRPTSWSERFPTVGSGANAIDADPATFATVLEATPGQSAAIDVFGFPDGAISPVARSSVKIRVRSQWAGADLSDLQYIAVSKDSGATFRRAATIQTLSGFPVLPDPPAWLEFEVAGLVGLAPASAIRVRVQFANGSETVPPPDLELV